MAGKVGLRFRRAADEQNSDVLVVDTVHSRAECLMQLLKAFHDIADYDDIHEAARRLELVQAWIRHETGMAAGDAIFDDDTDKDLRTTQARA